MNKKYDNNNIIIASRAYFLHKAVLNLEEVPMSNWCRFVVE
jgi:hypothetical protein